MVSKLGEILVERRVVTVEEIGRAMSDRQGDERVGDALVRLGFASHGDVARALAEQTGLPLADLTGFDPAAELLALARKAGIDT